MNRMRVRISERLKQSQNTAASLTTFNEIDMSSLMEMRKLYKDEIQKEKGIKIGFMSAFAKAATLALKEIPAANASIEGEGTGDTILYRDYVDLSVAVATPKGLVTPVVRNAESLGFVEIEQEIANLGKKARDGKLTLEDMSGGSFTISNGGVFGSLYGTVRPPPSLSFARSRRRADELWTGCTADHQLAADGGPRYARHQRDPRRPGRPDRHPTHHDRRLDLRRASPPSSCIREQSLTGLLARVASVVGWTRGGHVPRQDQTIHRRVRRVSSPLELLSSSSLISRLCRAARERCSWHDTAPPSVQVSTTFQFAHHQYDGPSGPHLQSCSCSFRGSGACKKETFKCTRKQSRGSRAREAKVDFVSEMGQGIRKERKRRSSLGEAQTVAPLQAAARRRAKRFRARMRS